MPKTITAYIGLLRRDGTEPPREAGYKRAAAGDVDLWDIAKLPYTGQHIFPDVTAPGYGHIVEYAAYTAPEGGEPLIVWHLPEPVDCHKGTVPFIHEGRLLLGVDVSAEIKLYTPCASTVTR